MTETCKSQGVRYRFLLRVFMCYVPLAVGLSMWAWRDAALSEIAKTALIAVGLLVWTLIEYLLHRFLLHYRPQAAGTSGGRREVAPGTPSGSTG